MTKPLIDSCPCLGVSVAPICLECGLWIEYPSLLTDLFSRAFPRAFFFYVWSNSFLVLFALALKPEAQT